MADNSLITKKQYNEDINRFYDEKIYPFLNGATHTGCVPLGTILPYFGETAPTHFLICDGTTYNKADYPELAAHLLALTDPTPYAGSDANHFKVPDLRGEFLRGTGTNSHTNQGNGANVGVHQDGTNNPMYFVTSGNTVQIRADKSNNTPIGNVDSQYKVGTVTTHTLASTSEDSGSVNYLTTRPTNTSVTYIIAYRNAYIDLALDSFPIDITQPTDGQLLMYDATAGRWVNGGHKYSTSEHVVGTWIDGKPLYEKTIKIVTPSGTTSSVGQSDFIVDSNLDFGFIFNTTAHGTVMTIGDISNNKVAMIRQWIVPSLHCVRVQNSVSAWDNVEFYSIVRYTKSTDTV